MYQDLKQLFRLSNIPLISANEEVDFMCAKLCKDGIASPLLSKDMDLSSFGRFTLNSLL